MVFSSSSTVIKPLLFSTSEPAAEDDSLSGLSRDTKIRADAFSNSENIAPWLKFIEGIMLNRLCCCPMVATDGNSNQITQLPTPSESPQMAPVLLARCQ